ncbi:thiamine pyrophosphate-binding protein [Pseudomonas aeruginosa]|uniref:thiamine pyrophosphate-binding protein n=1 Tax=Pseudomonas aeruginosa TaxID=287 RepID=UPI0003C3691D|nr:thiamine pyrophosphate-binding protein [Pseudomonas aeruginosa]ESR69679.1 thiamine pyrophosphate protein [Pseudomonas aeruginosa VRFPA05]EJV1370692.1 thiamine pyrophosphate-binding protein [Pseudomonas aeruginosa]EJV1383630.1 thiamine pyrophosphate-binding protein [Pseudomonas aeruginosa]EJV1609221.1 thiamine pyrophosphate-binding protein [Pseudomonas aeruginosa]EKD1565339.1 thiamine pyrophosphate-binding protein [Pseudomonas aeruginosa]
MSDSLPQRNGGQILVEALRRNAVDTVYCIPGESYLPVLDALHDADGIRTVVTRHEGAASNMADAYGKLTGRPGICFVTRGPGATHAANGVHTAQQDSTPMILFVGQVESAFKGREAFQEVDYVQMFSGLAKWAVEIDRIERIPELVGRAFSVATSGRPGPVVVALPEEILFGSAQVADAPVPRVLPGRPGATAMAELRELLANARRPLLVLGGSGWDGAARKRLGAFVEANGLPVVTSFRRQDLFDNRDPHYAGQLGFGAAPALLERLRQADLLLVVGARLGETPSAGYSLVRSPAPAQTLVHVHPDSAELNRVYLARLPIQATPCAFAEALADLAPLPSSTWQDWREAAHADYLAYSTPAASDPAIQGVDLASVVAYLSENLPDDAVIANGAGNYAVWVHRFYRYRQARTQLAPTNGAMGYGLPAAIAASLRDPQRSVVCFAGDGCFMMYPQELATAAQFGATPVVIVVNNGMLGTIRMHQEREYPGRVSATRLANPDFVALARAFGAHAERVECSADFPAAFRRARESGRPALLELLTDPRQITPQARLA